MELAQLKSWLDEQLNTIHHDDLSVGIERNLLLEHFLDISIEALYSNPKLNINPQTPSFQQLERALNQRIKERMPLQYILGQAFFYKRQWVVTTDVLIPRPETELLVEHTLTCLKDYLFPRVLDLGTGSGCIAISIKLEASKDTQVFAVDKSPAALGIAQMNAITHQANVEFMISDWFSAIPVTQRFDVIVSNPPYIDPQERHTLQPELSHEPEQALFYDNPTEALYPSLLKQAQAYLDRPGMVILELGKGQAKVVEPLAQALGYQTQVIMDYTQTPRILCCHLAPST